MTKMTAAEAIEWLTSDKAFGQECYSRKQIAALLEQQQVEIERLKCCGNCEHFDLGHDGMHIEPQCKLTTYYLEPWQKCDKWEVVSNG